MQADQATHIVRTGRNSARGTAVVQGAVELARQAADALAARCHAVASEADQREDAAAFQSAKYAASVAARCRDAAGGADRAGRRARRCAAIGGAAQIALQVAEYATDITGTRYAAVGGDIEGVGVGVACKTTGVVAASDRGVRAARGGG